MRELLGKPGQRRGRYRHVFKAELLALCRQPGASVPALAREHGVGVQTLRRWLDESPGIDEKAGPAWAGLRRWTALTRYLDDGMAAMDNNHIENLIRPVALGRKNWLFAGSLRAGQRAAAIMSLIQSAMLSGHDPHAYLKDVLTRLPLTRAADIDQLLPHNWKPAQPQG